MSVEDLTVEQEMRMLGYVCGVAGRVACDQDNSDYFSGAIKEDILNLGDKPIGAVPSKYLVDDSRMYVGRVGCNEKQTGKALKKNHKTAINGLNAKIDSLNDAAREPKYNKTLQLKDETLDEQEIHDRKGVVRANDTRLIIKSIVPRKFRFQKIL